MFRTHNKENILELAPPTMPTLTKIQTVSAVEKYDSPKANTIISQFVNNNSTLSSVIKDTQESESSKLLSAFQVNSPGSPNFQSHIATVIRDYGKTTDEALNRLTDGLLDFPTRLEDENSAFTKTGRDLATLTQIVRRNRIDATSEQNNTKGSIVRFFRKVTPKATDKVEMLIINNATASENINAITEGLLSNKEELLREIININGLQEGLWDALIALYARELIFEALKTKVEQWEHQLRTEGRTHEADAVRNQALMVVTRHIANTVTQGTSSLQSYQSAKASEQNLNKYIDAIDEAVNITMQAYKNNLYFSRILNLGDKVEAQLSALTEATESLILENARLIGDTTVRLAEREAQMAINPDVLIEAQDIMIASAEQALEIRSKSIEVLTTNTERVREARNKALETVQRQG